MGSPVLQGLLGNLILQGYGGPYTPPTPVVACLVTQGFGATPSILTQGYRSAAVLSLRQAVRARLAGSAAITAAVSTRIYFTQPSQKAGYPAISISVASRSYGHTLDGPDGTSVADIEISVYSAQELDCIAIGELVRNLIDGETGTTWSGIPIDFVLLDEEEDEDFDPIWKGNDSWIYKQRQTYQIGHRVSIPTRG